MQIKDLIDVKEGPPPFSQLKVSVDPVLNQLVLKHPHKNKTDSIINHPNQLLHQLGRDPRRAIADPQTTSNLELADTTFESMESTDPLYTSQLNKLGKLGDTDLGYLSTTVGLNEAGYFNAPPSNGEAIVEPRKLMTGLEKTLKRRISMNTLKFDQLQISSTFEDEDESTLDLQYNASLFRTPSIHSPVHKTSNGHLKSCLKSSSSNDDSASHGKAVNFNRKYQLTETWNDDDYDRKNPDMKRVSVMVTYYPRELIPIRKEINELKREMKIHPSSVQNTHYLKV